MPGGTDWATLAPAIVAAVGVGTIAGSVITTYGGRGQQRRKVRSRALKQFESLEVIRETITDPHAEQDHPLTDMPAFKQLRVNCMIAGVPRSIIDVYGNIGDDGPWLGTVGDSDPVLSGMLSVKLGYAAAQLIRDALYRPTVTRVTYRWRVRKLHSVAEELYGPKPSMIEWSTFPDLYRHWRRTVGAGRGLRQESGSRLMRRIKVLTGMQEYINITEFLKELERRPSIPPEDS